MRKDKIYYMLQLLLLFAVFPLPIWGVRKQPHNEAYLMVYHKDEDHSLHMALSRDGYTFVALNGGKPVVAGDTIARQKGIRDPHIYRGPDGAFYVAMTDLHIYAQKAGYRTTKWERDEDKYGWGNNRALVLMKSHDLIHWQHHSLRIDTLAPELKEMAVAWAPETIYDEEAKRMMVYFTMGIGREMKKLYYVYTNDNFDTITTAPKTLFSYPNPKYSAIDADIIHAQGKYIMFYKTNDGRTGIRRATSNRASGPYTTDSVWYDSSPVACEGPNVWKRIGENKWVLMYDIYGRKQHNFGFRETADFQHFVDLGEFNQGPMKTINFSRPKHGAVVLITKQEADQLEKYWNRKEIMK